MARRTQVLDDHDKSEINDGDSITIRIGGTQWEADLSQENQQKLLDIVSEFLPDVAPSSYQAAPHFTPRAPRTPRASRTSSSSSAQKVDASERASQRNQIISWVKSLTEAQKSKIGDAKWDIGRRGRIDGLIVSAFYDAHPEAERLFKTSG